MSALEVLAVPGALARLVKRDATLDGSVPLRVAQACVPLLEGNAIGHQVVFGRRLLVTSTLGRLGLERTPALDEVAQAHRAAVPVLAAQGLLERGGPWHTQLEKSWWWVERGVLRVWTGLLVRPRRGTWLRVSGAGSRAILGLEVRTAYVGGEGRFVPLVIDVSGAEGGTRLDGEIATVLSVVPAVATEVVGVGDAPELARRHAAFYDAKYFATKKGEVTRKYRRTVIGRARGAGSEPAEADETAACATMRVATIAGPAPEVLRIDHVLGASSLTPAPAPAGESLQAVRFANAIGFTAHYDGNTLAVEPDREALGRAAPVIEAALAASLGAAFAREHRGSLLYLTKYFTPHPNGEPHFFVKPWAFTETPPGWSCLVDGVRGKGWDVMRGVVWTDRFHATPAVFSVQAGARVKVPAGTPLVEVVALPRALVAEGFTEVALGP